MRWPWVAYQDTSSGVLSLYINGQAAHAFPAGSAALSEVVANNGAVVVRDGNTSTSPISVFQIGQTPVTIASTGTGFSALGGSPGISADGQVVVFYGDLTTAGATAINNAQPGFAPVTAGPGIFASIADQIQGRVVVEIAGVSSTSSGVPGLTATARVGVNAITTPNGTQTLTIDYTGTNASGGAELYYSGLTFNTNNGFLDATNPATIQVTAPVPLLGVGDTIDDVSGAVQSITGASSPNNSGVIAVTLTSGSNNYAVIRVLTADIVIDSVATTDSREAIVDYEITDPNLTTSFSIQLYRSDQAIYSSTDTKNMPIGQPIQVSTPLPGNYTATVDLSQANSNWGQPVAGQAAELSLIAPLAPDPLLPYVLAVADPTHRLPAGIAIDESDAHFHIYGSSGNRAFCS